MKFGREKRLILGLAALLVAIPLPFNEVLEWPLLLVYEGFVVFFLQRADAGNERWLPNWALNLLGLVFIPTFAIDLKWGLVAGKPVQAVLHLLLFLVLVKLFSMREERHKWHTTILIFFVFLGAMATSSHVSISPYLVAFAVLSGLVLNRFATLHTATTSKLSTVRGLGRQGLLSVGLATAVLAMPLFATLPRLREPIVLGRGGTVGAVRTTGFSDSVDLNLTTSIRANRDVALRVKLSQEVVRAEDLRFKAATYEHYRDRKWLRAFGRTVSMTKGREADFEISNAAITSTAEIFLEALSSSSLVLPIETARVEIDTPALLLDPGGAVLLPGIPRDTIRYQAKLAAMPVIEGALEGLLTEASALDIEGVSDRLVALGSEVMGTGSAEVQLDRLLAHLLRNYTYTLDFVGREGDSPIEDFLFEYRSGHCEYFATAMVLLARSQGIPARLVTGFLGAEFNPLEDYYIVRQQNAHAWVEAFSPSRGWQVYDPTPPDGRPVIAERSLGLALAQIYDFLTFRWDRYVLTFSAGDQESFFRRLRERFSRMWRQLMTNQPSEPSPESDSAPNLAREASVRDSVGRSPVPSLEMLAVSATALLLICALILHRRRRYPAKASVAYLRARSLFANEEPRITDSLAPLGFLQLVGDLRPAAVPAVRTIVELYVGESFGSRAVTIEDRDALGRALGALQQVL